MKKKYVFLGIALVLCAAAWTALNFWEQFTRKYPGEQAAWIKIPANPTQEQVLDSLRAQLGYSYGKTLHDIWKIINSQPGKAAGAYLVQPGEPIIDIARRLKSGNQTPVKITFNNIRTAPQLADRIAGQLDFTAAQFLAKARQELPSAGFDSLNITTPFLPDTYEFYYTATPKQVIDRLLAYYNSFWTPERLQKAGDLGLTPSQVITLASIVDEETAAPFEKPTIARLYLNRLKKGMKLQADPTVKFAVGDFTLRRILNQHLSTPSPYNTYLHEGLPPGPIRIPEKSTIDAVLNAPANNYLYMCAKEDFSGTHNFATTLEQHNANAARYRAALNARGIK